MIDRWEFDESEYTRAAVRLRDNLEALAIMLDRERFGVGEPSIGAELEMSIVDDDCRGLPVNSRVLAESLDPRLQLEIDAFNLEYNVSPVSASGTPFSAMQKELEEALATLAEIVAGMDGRIIPIGILPTLDLEQLRSDALTDLPRYRALSAGLRRIRQEDIRIRIDGEEPLDTTVDSVSIEGANTSFQLHLRVNPAVFADCYNAAQLVTPLALALAANSPLLLGHKLWDETRIALFKQAVDTRGSSSYEWRRAARVPFGHGWIRKGAYELFAESCYLYPIIVPLTSDEDPLEVVRSGGTPELMELRLHQGTIWNWNRPVYDAADGGHLRIEFRSLPAGPTPQDMMANAAFLIGLTIGISGSINRYLPAFPFRYAEYNFYRAAQRGLDAELLWPTFDESSPRLLPVTELCRDLLPLADHGLAVLGVADAERARLLGLMRERLETGNTPARWQRRALARLDVGSRPAALKDLVEEYLDNVAGAAPVAAWG